MKKFTITSFLIVSVFMAIPMLVSASTSVSLSPNSGTYNVGSIYSVNIYINPQGTKIYTAKLETKYPTDLIEVTSFTFASGLMPLSQPGYDLVDNTNGTIIKTAGYSGGSSSSGLFGTITFRVKKAGQGTVEMTTNSQAYDENNTNVISSLPKATYTFTESPVVAQPVIKSEVPVKTTPKTTQKTVETKSSIVEKITDKVNATTSLAAVGQTNVGGNILYWILTIIASSIISFWIGFRIGKKSRGN